MDETDPREAHRTLALDLLRRHDGAERIPRLPFAQLITIAPAAAADDPVHVTIIWGPGNVEQPFPGSSLWRAVLDRHLREPRPGPPTPAEPVLRAQIERSLERFPDLDTWWQWLRTGWTAPPTPESERKPGRRAERGSGWSLPW